MAVTGEHKSKRRARTGPRHRRLGAAVFRFMLPLFERFYASKRIYRLNSKFAQERLQAVRAKLARGETVYIAGVGAAGTHNSGIALVEVTRARGPRLICNNEEERFSGNKHTTEYPRHAIDDLLKTMTRIGIGPDDIDAWVATWDYPALAATLLRITLEELPGSLSMLRPGATPAFNIRHLDQGTRAPRTISRQVGASASVSLIGIPHHDNHAWYSFAVSPFAREAGPVIIAVLDGTGDRGSISIYLTENGTMRQLRCNDSVFDSLGVYYSVISSTQGGWTYLSSEGRYMGAAAFGNGDRRTNPYYPPLREIFSLEPEGQVYLNRSLANWHRKIFHAPYTAELTRILGAPIPPEKMWNPDAVLRVEDIHHAKDTQERVDKAAATQMVFEDALFHIVDHFIRQTGSDRLILTGGTGLNAIANQRLLEHFDAAYYQRALNKRTRLHLWVPPTPADSGVTMGAAYMFAYLAGAGIGEPIEHAFYCGSSPSEADIQAALDSASDIGWMRLGDISSPQKRDAIADLMAYMVAQDGVIAIFQGPAETGPRALGHRSIVANPCNPRIREILNERVKYREAVRPLAPMATLEAAQRWFKLSTAPTTTTTTPIITWC